MDVSIIIPCFNHGQYIQDAIESTKQIENIDYEVIIVNDGSTDPLTLRKLKELEDIGYTVISHENSGPAFSRNAGIRNSTGRYILPLDADNKLKPEYIYKGIRILDKGMFDIVYANPIFFGEDTPSRKFRVRPFNGDDLFIDNYIDTCALFKREVWEVTGGYDSDNRFKGHEDWEFWVHAFVKGFRFYHLDEALYYYRIVENSLATQKQDADNSSREYILKKHFNAFTKTMISHYSYGKMYLNDMENPLRAAIKYLSYSLKMKK